MADELPRGTLRETATGSSPVVGATLDSATVVSLIRFESISPLKATTFCGTSALTIESGSGDELATPKRCIAFTAASRLIEVADCCAPAVIHCLITSIVDCGR